MKTVPLPGRWDEVQEAVRAYAQGHNLLALPGYHVPQEDASFDPLRVYNQGAADYMAWFKPFFKRDGRTLLHVRASYEEGYGAEDLLQSLGADLSAA